MKYLLVINQKEIMRLSPSITESEAIILDYLIFFCNCANVKIELQRFEGYTWIDYQTIIDDLPILSGRSKPSISEKIKKIEEYGYIITKDMPTQSGHNRKYFKLTEKCLELQSEYIPCSENRTTLFGKLNDPVQKTERPCSENRTNKDIIYKDIIYKDISGDDLCSKKGKKEATINNSCSKVLGISEGDDTYQETVKYLRDKVIANNPKFGIRLSDRNIKVWASEIRKLVEVEGEKIDDIKKTIDWSQGDGFWKDIIVSAKKLKDKYPQLHKQMEKEALSGTSSNKVSDTPARKWDITADVNGKSKVHNIQVEQLKRYVWNRDTGKLNNTPAFYADYEQQAIEKGIVLTEDDKIKCKREDDILESFRIKEEEEAKKQREYYESIRVKRGEKK